MTAHYCHDCGGGRIFWTLVDTQDGAQLPAWVCARCGSRYGSDPHAPTFVDPAVDAAHEDGQ